MTVSMRTRRWAGLALVSLAACGGGGGGGAGGNPAPPSPTVAGVGERCEGTALARFDSEPMAAGRTGELHLLSCGAVLDSLQWSQTEGPPLALLSARSPSLALHPTLPGSYRFSVRFRDTAGVSHSGSVGVNVGAAGPARSLLTRGEPSVWAGGQLSLRAGPQGISTAELLNSSTRWEQLSGPAADLGSSNTARLVFRAPEVNRDELVVLRATLTLADGSQLQDQFRLLVQPQPLRASAPLFDGSSPATRVYPYLENGPHASALSRCIYSPALSNQPNNLCTLGELPLLGQVSSAPSVEQVMQRLLVSNDWMGEAFERFLREQDPQGDFRRMLASTTAVVIGGRVRPSFYWSATGAIYIDAAYLWQTPEQRDTVSEAADPRAGNGPLLQYSMPWRYVRNNDYTAPARPVAERGSRSLESLRYELARLMYHELAHAADFLPPRSHGSLNRGQLVYQAVPSQTTSARLQQQLPFFSQVMVALGRVLFFGETATALQNSYLPEDIAGFFSADRVNSDYSYSLPASASVPREDTAMLLEEALMQLRYGVLRDVAVTPKLRDGMASADMRVIWGQRGRIGESAIRPRVALVLGELMPWVPLSELDRLAAPLPLRAGQSWGENLDLSAPRPRALSAAQRAREVELALERAQLRASH